MNIGKDILCDQKERAVKGVGSGINVKVRVRLNGHRKDYSTYLALVPIDTAKE